MKSKSQIPWFCDIEFENEFEKWDFMRKLGKKKLEQVVTALQMEVLMKTNSDLRAENEKLTTEIQRWKLKSCQFYKENCFLLQQLSIGRAPHIIALKEGFQIKTPHKKGNRPFRNRKGILRQGNQVLSNLNTDWEAKVVGYAKALVDCEAKEAENAKALVVNKQRLSAALEVVESLKKEISRLEKLMESKNEYPRLCDIEFENDTEKWAFMRELASKKSKQDATAPEMEVLKKTNSDLTEKTRSSLPKYNCETDGISGPTTSINHGNLEIQTDSELLQPKPEKMWGCILNEVMLSCSDCN